MERPIVAVDRDLSRFGETLEAAGFRVVAAGDADVAEAEVVVLDGMDDQAMGMENREIPAPIVDAAGMTADQVVAAVRQHIHPR